MDASDRRLAAAHVFVDDLDALELAGDDSHHLSRVLRLRPGETVTASDGAGRWRSCTWTQAGALEAVGDVVAEERPVPPVTVGFSLLKGDRTEWVVQKLTEVGVDRIAPLVAERTVVRWEGDRARKHEARLVKVAREAAMQSRRVWLPEVLPVARVGDAVRAGEGVALAHFGGFAPSLTHPTVLVGPEGGWSDDEVAAAPVVTSLGPGVLRAETAAVAAAVLLVGLRGGVVRETTL